MGSTKKELERIERTQLELNVITGDSLKEALLFVDLDALTIAETLSNIIRCSTKDADRLKALDTVIKVRGDYVQAAVDDRPININFPAWGDEKERKEEETPKGYNPPPKDYVRPSSPTPPPPRPTE